MKKLALLSLSMGLFAPFVANALTVNTMELVSDPSGNGVFSLTNNNSYTEYVTATITKVEAKGTELVKTQYTGDNVKDWEITLSNPKIIIESGRSKNVGVRSLCVQDCNFDSDRVYQINFAPVPYADGEAEAPRVALNVGYAPVYFIPAKHLKLDYTIENRGNELHVENRSNSLIRIGVDNCGANPDVTCRSAYTILGNRTITQNIPELVRGQSLKVTVVSHDESHVNRFVLDVNKPVSGKFESK